MEEHAAGDDDVDEEAVDVELGAGPHGKGCFTKRAPFAGAAVGAPAMAADLAVTVEIPRLSVAEYHKPYVAIWVEAPDATAAGSAVSGDWSE